jgi:oligopeptide transport system substrate-binding protein
MKRLRTIGFNFALLLLAACSCAEDRGPTDTTLNRGIIAEPDSLDAHKASSIQAANVLRDIGEGLVSYTENGALTPGVAERWAVSDDGLRYTFYLRPNARWSNGDTVTAEHFVFSVQRLVAPETAAFYAQFLSDVAGVEAIGEQTLVVTLKRPTAYLLSLLSHPATFPMHPGAIEKHGASFARPGKLLSNGAYVLQEWIPGSVITLQRNVNYWNNDATAIDTVKHHIVTEPTSEFARYRSGELDLTDSIPPNSLALARKELGDQVRVAPQLGVYYYGFNLTKPPFKGKPHLRQALSMAIDRDALVEKVTARGEVPAYGWVPPGVDNYAAVNLDYAALTQAERNRQAQQLYRAAGYGDENPLQLEMRYNTADTERRVALAIQAMWREVLGVETTLINEEFKVLLSNIADREITQAFRSSWIGDYNDAHTFLGILQSDNAANAPGYESGEYDQWMQRAAQQVDVGQRRLFLQEAERVLLADHPVIPIYFYISTHLVSPRIVGWGDNVLNYHYSQHLSFKAAE